MDPSPPLPPELRSVLTILDVLTEGVLLVDRSNRVVSVNRPLASLLGLDRDALPGIELDLFTRRYLSRCIAEEGTAAKMTALLQDRDKTAEFVCTVRTSGGREREFHISGDRIEDGAFRGMGVARFQDITGEVRLKQELLECAEKYRTVFDSLDSGFAIIEMLFPAGDRPVDYRFIETNRAFERLTGMRDVVGKTMRELAPGHEEHWFEIFGAVARTGEPGRFVQTAKFLTDRWYEVYAFPFGETGCNRVAVLFSDITDRRRAEDELRENEEKYRQVFATMGAGFAVLEVVPGDAGEPVDFVVLDVDPAYESIMGSKHDQVVGRRITEVAPGVGKTWAERCAESLITGRPEQFEGYNPAKDRWYGVYAGPMPGKGRCALIFTDITERKQAEEALSESEEKFRALVEYSLDGTLILDPVGTILFANHTAARLVGIENPDEAIGRRNVTEFVAPVSKADALKDFEQVAEGIDGYVARYQILTVTQEERWVESIGRSILYNGVPAILISLRDVTERCRAEEALRESEEKYRTLFDSAGDPILIHDLEGNLLDVNRVAVERFGYSREELLKRDLVTLTPREFSALAPERIREIVRNGHMVFETADITREGRRIPTEVSARLIAYRGRPAVLAIDRDITERKQAEEALERRTEDLIRANREIEAARDEANMYLDIMTHDVRNANNVSSMYADLLLDLTEGDLKVYAEKLHASIDRSSEILGNVATIRRASESPGNLVPMDLDAVIREEIENFPNAAIHYRGARIEVLADILLSAVFSNLIGNAVKFGGPGVVIEIRVEEQDSVVLVSVEDAGPGIPDEVKRRLFRRFERGMATGQGEGLGLFIVRTLVERYGGRIRVEDRVPGCPERGAAFRFVLKRAG